jgi:uncharacterized protein
MIPGPASAPLFLDTGFAIALLSPRDFYHARAQVLAAELKAVPRRIVTTDAVIYEIGAALSKVAWRQAATCFIAALRQDPNVEIVTSEPALAEQAFDLFRSRSDKDWSLADCLSFVVMLRHNINTALSADEHFRQAGYEPLLLTAETA